jgi:hypothetical protein
MLLPARLLAMFCYMIKVGRAHIQDKKRYRPYYSADLLPPKILTGRDGVISLFRLVKGLQAR